MDIKNEIKAIIIREGLTIKEVVEHMSLNHGWSGSIPNFSDKLKRNSLRYYEAIELADELGYDVVWQKRK